MSMKEPQSLDEAFELVSKQMLVVFQKKHKDYGKGNILDTGDLGIAFRVNDKLNRLKHLLTTKAHPINESMEETWIDVAVYSVIAVMYLHGWFQKLHLKKDPK